MRNAVILALAMSLIYALLATVTAAASKLRPALGEHYFLVVWSYQGPDDDVVHAHTFTSFYKGDDLARDVLRPSFTISWLPATGAVHLFGAEEGRNFSLGTTLAMACQAGRQMQSWGPIEISSALYRRALSRHSLLQSGRIRYAMINGSADTMNCIKAAGDLTSVPLDSGILWGIAAGAEVVRHLSPYFVSDTPLKSLIPLTRGCSLHKDRQLEAAGE